MNEFLIRLEKIDRNKLKDHLQSLKSPCYESELFKIAFPQSMISGADPLELYQNHFLLFHILYLLQEDLYLENKYLHIHFMRTSLVDYPGAGMCRFYDEYAGRFCGEGCRERENYCVYHLEIVGENEIEELSARYFYLDKENFYGLNRKTAEAFIRGTWETLRYYNDYKESFRILDLPESADIDMIKKKFRALAKEYHPDLGAISHERFNEINRAYRLLVQLKAFKPV
jgi:hypothetical protein